MVGSSWTPPSSRPQPLAITSLAHGLLVQPTHSLHMANSWQPSRPADLFSARTKQA